MLLLHLFVYVISIEVFSFSLFYTPATVSFLVCACIQPMRLPPCEMAMARCLLPTRVFDEMTGLCTGLVYCREWGKISCPRYTPLAVPMQRWAYNVVPHC